MTEQAVSTTGGSIPEHDFLVIGAGVCGIYQLYRLRELGADVLVIDALPDIGGTWQQNRYPGCRFDSESYSYGYSFSPELLQEWSWSEHFATQPETLRYLGFVVDKFDLRKHMQFDCRVHRAAYDDAAAKWTVSLEDGRTFRCRFLITALGLLSAPTLPRIPGMDTFRGPSFHTFHWPHEPLDLTGQRVGIIGTGATGVQVIGAIADQVGELTVFQRRPNWCAPLHNRPITEEEMAAIKASYDEIFAKCAKTPGGFIHGPDRRKLAEVPPEERLRFWEQLYAAPGFQIWLGNFRDVLMDEEANAEFSAFIADKIRSRMHDPAVAEKLVPKDHGFGVQRVPMETRYYEAYNRDNVHLIDIEETPIRCVTETGITTSARHHELDIIIYATGFDAITGSFDRIEFVGTDGVKLRDKWRDGPSTYLGVATAGFPNMVMLAGPQGAANSTNFPRAIEYGVEWATDLYRHIMEHDITRVDVTADAEAEWTQHVQDLYGNLLLRKAKSWFTGYNENVEGHTTTRYLMYTGGAPRYRKTLDEVADTGYRGFVFS